jgi:hypothetical protein
MMGIVGNIFGPTGATGGTGGTGATGTTGGVGATGYTGVTGITGTTGAAGTAGVDGSAWYSGAGVPSDATGVNGDYYLNTTNGDVYFKAGGTWF